MLLDRPELESGEELEQLSRILEAEEGNSEESDRAVDEHLTQIIMRREGESRKDYGLRVDRFISYLRFQENTSYITADEDTRFGYGEIREISIGQLLLTTQQRIIIALVVYTDRDGIIRLISARKASKQERKEYEQQSI